MYKDHRPYWLKKVSLRLQKIYVERFLRPQFDRLGRGHLFIKPWHVELFGGPIEFGRHVTVIATADNPVRLSVWSESESAGAISIGSCCLVCPGVRLGSAAKISIADDCMLAFGVYITDADWHDLYDRVSIGRTAPVRIERNVWVGDSAIICKGVTVGENSVVGAGAVVARDVPANVVVAGNPARVVRQLDPSAGFTTRSHWFANPRRLWRDFDLLDRDLLGGNTLGHWLRYLMFPRRGE